MIAPFFLEEEPRWEAILLTKCHRYQFAHQMQQFVRRSCVIGSLTTSKSSRIPIILPIATSSPHTPARSQRQNAPEDNILLLKSEEHTSELQSLMRISYDVFCLKKKKS